MSGIASKADRDRIRQKTAARRAAEEAALKAARALSEAVMFDDSGVNGRGGSGGLLSRETIRKNDELKLALSRVQDFCPEVRSRS